MLIGFDLPFVVIIFKLSFRTEYLSINCFKSGSLDAKMVLDYMLLLLRQQTPSTEKNNGGVYICIYTSRAYNRGLSSLALVSNACSETRSKLMILGGPRKRIWNKFAAADFLIISRFQLLFFCKEMP